MILYLSNGALSKVPRVRQDYPTYFLAKLLRAAVNETAPYFAQFLLIFFICE
jgi:hypothetical protein